MAFFSLILAPILYVPVYYVTRRMRKLLEELFANSQNIFERLNEVFSHIYLVKVFGKEKKETRGYLGALIKNIRITLKNLRLEVISSFAGSGFNRIIIGLITLFGGYQVIRGRISAGTLTAIMIYLSQLIGLQGQIAFFFQKIAFGLVSCKRIDEVLEEEIKLQKKVKIYIEGLKIGFDKVSFGYRHDEYILKNFDFNINKGWISLVGPSGCGKSTIINLLLGLYRPWDGEIFIDGRNIKDLDASFLREQIGVALQEPFLWNDTIENNIRYAKSDATKQEIIEISRLSGVDEFVRDLPSGYETIIGENACKISEGQKQKIAIARALIKRPKILVLDEAMSSMDSVSEEKIIRKIKELPINIVILISHRLSSVMASDAVYFLKEPRKIVIDSPQLLLKKDIEFYNLFQAQITEINPQEDIIQQNYSNLKSPTR